MEYKTASIPYNELVVGKLYTILVIARNAICYGVLEDAAVGVTDTTYLPIEKNAQDLLGRSMWKARLGPGRYDLAEILFYPITHDLETSVYAWREKERLREWREYGTGYFKSDTPHLRRVGYTLIDKLREQAFARRKHAVIAWAAANSV